MSQLELSQIEDYLTVLFGNQMTVCTLTPLVGREPPTDVASSEHENVVTQPSHATLKTFGYGHPMLIQCQDADGTAHKIVFRIAKRNQFGHEYRADRAADLLASYARFNTCPRHTRALDVGFITTDQQLLSAAAAKEFYLLTEYVEGQPYADDLQRIRITGECTEQDIARAQALAGYLAEIHSERQWAPELYRRHLRDVFGSGEGIAGLLDSYPDDDVRFTRDKLRRLEIIAVDWRWKLKLKNRRLAQIHGDFHPFNILFEEGTTFHLLDRSRSPWGEPADDVSCMAINYLFFSLQRTGTMESPFLDLWQTFWHTYLNESKDTELLDLCVPFLIWRALVLANPIWYAVSDLVRWKLYVFIQNLTQINTINPDRINDYIASADG